VYLSTWCLADDQQLCGARQLQNWSGAERQPGFASRAGTNITQ
jgi:hypothetical protein